MKCKYECPEVEIVETLNFSEIMRAEFECIEEKIRHGEGIMNKILAGLAIGLSSVMAVTHLRFGLSVNASLTGRTKISAFLPFSQFIVQGRSAYILL